MRRTRIEHILSALPPVSDGRADIRNEQLRARSGHCRHSLNGTLWNIARDRLHWLDVGRHNHLAPFLDFVGDELAAISGRAWKHRAAQIGKPCFEFWICNAGIDFLVQSFDVLYGRALRSTNAEP